MKKIPKVFLTIGLILSIFMSGTEIFADSSTESSFVSADFDGVVLTTEYLTDDVKAEYFETATEYGFNFIELNSGAKLETISSDISPEKITGLYNRGMVNPMSSGSYLREFRTDIYLTYDGKSAIFSSDVILELYHYNSYRQINKYSGGTLRARSSGEWTIESPLQSVISPTGKFPTVSVQVHSSGTATITKGSAISSGFSIEFLKGVGFDVSNSTSSTTYIRKYISKTYTISLY